MTMRFSHLSLAPGKRQCHVLMHGGAVLLKHKKSSQDNLHMSDTVASEQKSCRDSMPSSL